MIIGITIPPTDATAMQVPVATVDELYFLGIVESVVG